ncbi:hypothetical protein NDU88_010668 [Pleurodeles waltl]|uniref:Uncharacterized protein n=1 Tax=Pleurodeles waltl TaxID=8319 RepID=A0AAV7PYR4_PLEWA|nr:hypothetical protein NDU88_010668 [Pleurodeles waltl]
MRAGSPAAHAQQLLGASSGEPEAPTDPRSGQTPTATVESGGAPRGAPMPKVESLRRHLTHLRTVNNAMLTRLRIVADGTAGLIG